MNWNIFSNNKPGDALDGRWCLLFLDGGESPNHYATATWFAEEGHFVGASENAPQWKNTVIGWQVLPDVVELSKQFDGARKQLP